MGQSSTRQGAYALFTMPDATATPAQQKQIRDWALEVKLSAGGFHTLRFDYFGTGDSGGEDAEADPDAAVADIETSCIGVSSTQQRAERTSERL